MTVKKATRLKKSGADIFVFAVGNYIKGIGEIVQVAGSSSSSKPDGYLFRLTNYHKFWNFSALVVKKVASTGRYVIGSPEPSPC